MQLFYVDGNIRVGPIGKSQFQTLIQTKKVNAKTLVWQPGMTQWEELGTFIGRRVPDSGKMEPLADTLQFAVCCECEEIYNQRDLIHIQDYWVCGTCKPIFLQKIKEGVRPQARILAELGLRAFVKTYAPAFITGLGDAWEKGELRVYHEHMASERLRDFLVANWWPLSRAANKRDAVVCATLPGERAIATTLGDLSLCMLQRGVRGPAILYFGLDWSEVGLAAPDSVERFARQNIVTFEPAGEAPAPREATG